jgi:hypothetical protein
MRIANSNPQNSMEGIFEDRLAKEAQSDQSYYKNLKRNRDLN